MAASNNFVLLDVRTPEEIANGKIDNAIEMDIKAPDFKEKLATLDKEKQYIVYCHAGGRSATAMQMMKDMGFKQVYNLISGYRAWPKNK
ncbi:MAG: rhodanese-like domain-containing protein [Saprospiraceae bacterium]|nr:rhodanese-like domain-containing protein [Saprospiraceae bacterium]MBK8669721.1 rhodanese-like domain-containing protein [Saprospiraceae bacterium]MBL0100021.1 rhodanese-like domain-containing protein [Saprospiraceae bacterium]